MLPSGDFSQFRKRGLIQATLLAVLALVGNVRANTCPTCDCDEVSTTASSHDACRILLCPLFSCSNAACAWSGAAVDRDVQQRISGTITIRLGPDSSSPVAPTAIIPVEGTLTMDGSNAGELEGGFRQVDLLIYQLALKSTAPLPATFPEGPMIVWDFGSSGKNTDLLPGSAWPMHSVFDMRYGIKFGSDGPSTWSDLVHLQTVVQPTDPVAGNNTAPAAHTWNSGPVEVRLEDGDGATYGWILDHDLNVVFSGGAGNPAQPASGAHAFSKQRYISWVPGPGCFDVYAFHVEHVESGRAYYVSTPRTSPPAAAGRGISVLVSDASPIIFDWSSQSVVHATGCLIAPGDQVNTAGAGHEYLVRSTGDGVSFSVPLGVFTAARPTDGRWWVDVVGSFSGGAWTAPNGLMNGFDITAIFRTFVGDPKQPGVTLERADINPMQVDRLVSGQDVLQAVNAFGIAPYPFSVPEGPGDNGQADCPEPPLSSQLAP